MGTNIIKIRIKNTKMSLQTFFSILTVTILYLLLFVLTIHATRTRYKNFVKEVAKQHSTKVESENHTLYDAWKFLCVFMIWLDVGQNLDKFVYFLAISRNKQFLLRNALHEKGYQNIDDLFNVLVSLAKKTLGIKIEVTGELLTLQQTLLDELSNEFNMFQTELNINDDEIDFFTMALSFFSLFGKFYKKNVDIIKMSQRFGVAEFIFVTQNNKKMFQILEIFLQEHPHLFNPEIIALIKKRSKIWDFVGNEVENRMKNEYDENDEHDEDDEDEFYSNMNTKYIDAASQIDASEYFNEVGNDENRKNETQIFYILFNYLIRKFITAQKVKEVQLSPQTSILNRHITMAGIINQNINPHTLKYRMFRFSYLKVGPFFSKRFSAITKVFDWLLFLNCANYFRNVPQKAEAFIKKCNNVKISPNEMDSLAKNMEKPELSETNFDENWALMKDKMAEVTKTLSQLVSTTLVHGALFLSVFAYDEDNRHYDRMVKLWGVQPKERSIIEEGRSKRIAFCDDLYASHFGDMYDDRIDRIVNY